MTQQQAESVKDLAKPVVEVLEKIGGKKCPKCTGGRTIPDHPGGRIPWKWKPKRGQFARIGMGMLVLVDRDGLFEDKFVETSDMGLIEYKRLVPTVPWEEIERVLEGVEYSLFVSGPNPLGSKYVATIGKYPASVKEDIKCCAKSRQEAVMRAIIELGKKE